MDTKLLMIFLIMAVIVAMTSAIIAAIAFGKGESKDPTENLKKLKFKARSIPYTLAFSVIASGLILITLYLLSRDISGKLKSPATAKKAFSNVSSTAPHKALPSYIPRATFAIK